MKNETLGTFVEALCYRIVRLIRLKLADQLVLRIIENDFNLYLHRMSETIVRVAQPTPVPKNGQKPIQAPLQTTKDLAQALLQAASAAANGTSDVHQVNALCQCTKSLIDLARLQIEATDKASKLPWLGE